MSTGAVQPTPGTSNTSTSFREKKKKSRSKVTQLEMFSWPIAQRWRRRGRQRRDGKRKSERHGQWS